MKTLMALLGMAALPMLSVTAWAQGNGQVKRPQVVGNNFMAGAKLQFAIEDKIIRHGRHRGRKASQRSNGPKENARPTSHNPSLFSDPADGVMIGRDAITLGWDRAPRARHA